MHSFIATVQIPGSDSQELGSLPTVCRESGVPGLSRGGELKTFWKVISREGREGAKDAKKGIGLKSYSIH